MITGCLTGSDYQRAALHKHLYGNPRSPLNGILNVPGTGEATAALRSAALSGISAIEPGGIVVGFYRHPGIADRMESFGVPGGTTSIRKLVLLSGDRQHGFPWAGSTPFGATCGGCGLPIKDANGNC
jgi:hypothetical protein